MRKKISVRFSFLSQGILMRFLAKKMREYREITPENDPCVVQWVGMVQRLQCFYL